MRFNKFVGRGCLTRRSDNTRRSVSALIRNVDAKITSDAQLRERIENNRAAQLASAERYRRSLIDAGILSPVA